MESQQHCAVERRSSDVAGHQDRGAGRARHADCVENATRIAGAVPGRLQFGRCADVAVGEGKRVVGRLRRRQGFRQNAAALGIESGRVNRAGGRVLVEFSRHRRDLEASCCHRLRRASVCDFRIDRDLGTCGQLQILTVRRCSRDAVRNLRPDGR